MVNKALGETLLHSAARKGYLAVVTDCLSKATCAIDSRDNAGYTPLHECCSQGHFEIAKLLLSHGANLHLCASGGRSALHEAVEADHISIVRLLLSYGADATLATYAGKTPLDLACSKRMKLFLSNFLCDLNGTSDVHSSDTGSQLKKCKANLNLLFTSSAPSSYSSTSSSPLPPLARFSSPHLTTAAAAPPRLVRFGEEIQEEEEEEENDDEDDDEEENEREVEEGEESKKGEAQGDETPSRKRRRRAEGEIQSRSGSQSSRQSSKGSASASVEGRRRRRRRRSKRKRRSKVEDEDQPPEASRAAKSRLPVVIEELESDTHFIPVYSIKYNTNSTTTAAATASGLDGSCIAIGGLGGGSSGRIGASTTTATENSCNSGTTNNAKQEQEKQQQQQLIEEGGTTTSERTSNSQYFVLSRDLHSRVKKEEKTGEKEGEEVVVKAHSSPTRSGADADAQAIKRSLHPARGVRASPSSSSLSSATTTTTTLRQVRMSDLKSVIVGVGVARGLGYEGYFSNKLQSILPLSEARRILPSTVHEFV